MELRSAPRRSSTLLLSASQGLANIRDARTICAMDELGSRAMQQLLAVCMQHVLAHLRVDPLPQARCGVAYWPSMSAECRSVSLVLVCGLLVETKVTPALAPGGHVLHTNPASGSNVVHARPSSASYVPRLQAAASRQCLPWRSPRQPSRTRRPCSPRLASPRLRSPAARRAGSSGRAPSPATPSARRRR